MKELRAMVSLPYACSDGVLCTVPGYNAATSIYAEFPHNAIAPIPPRPNRDEVEEALKTLWQPWRRFPFATAEDRAAMLAAILTAVCRPALTTAPGFFIDAPTPSSGKSKCAGALSALVRGRRGGATAFVDGQGAEAELLKKLVAMLRAGEALWFLDNVVGTWRSPVMCAFITDGEMNERLLGGNEWFRGDTRLMVVATGNNASLDRDLGRRLIRVRIDSQLESPQLRSFDFEPEDVALSERYAIARSVLVLVRAFVAAGAPRPGKGDCGFPEWNRLVRSCVLWLHQWRIAEEAGIGVLGDPACSILEGATTSDPDTDGLKLLLAGLEQAFGVDPFRARDVQAIYDCPNSNAGGLLVREGLETLLPAHREIKARSIGSVLRNRRDRPAGGRVVRLVGEDRDGLALWWVTNG